MSMMRDDGCMALLLSLRRGSVVSALHRRGDAVTYAVTGCTERMCKTLHAVEFLARPTTLHVLPHRSPRQGLVSPQISASAASMDLERLTQAMDGFLRVPFKL